MHSNIAFKINKEEVENEVSVYIYTDQKTPLPYNNSDITFL